MDETQAADEPMASAPTLPHARRRRWLWIVGGGLAIIAATLIPKGLTSNGPTGTSATRSRAPEFRLNRLDDPNRRVSLADFRGRPLVLNFWASWCLPCRTEMPAFESVSSQLTGRVDFLGVNEEDTQASALDLVAETGVRYPSVVDSGRVLASAYSLRGLPDTVFISSAGELLELHQGEFNATDLRAEIRRLFEI